MAWGTSATMMPMAMGSRMSRCLLAVPPLPVPLLPTLPCPMTLPPIGPWQLYRKGPRTVGEGGAHALCQGKMVMWRLG